MVDVELRERQREDFLIALYELADGHASRAQAEGIPNARIAERLGISRTTVIKAVRSTNTPNYNESPRLRGLR
jgi:DNA-binding Lrp family transcriptional regulator